MLRGVWLIGCRVEHVQRKDRRDLDTNALQRYEEPELNGIRFVVAPLRVRLFQNRLGIIQHSTNTVLWLARRQHGTGSISRY